MDRQTLFLLLMILFSLAGACGNDDDDDDTVANDDDTAEPLDPLIAQSDGLYDAEGRRILLRGFNARIEGIFDVTFEDGRRAVEPIPDFTADDCRFLARQIGHNHLRICMNWSGVEPERGVYDDAYIDRIADLAEACAAEGIVSVIDLHQDAYSKHIGEDGAPLWAIVPEPEQLLEGPLNNLTERRTSPQVLKAQVSFFDNVDGLQDAYAAMSAYLMNRLQDVPGVIGFEIMNEPVNLSDEEKLFGLYEAVISAVREVAPRMTIFFEPNSLRNRSMGYPVEITLDHPDLVYAPHTYPNFVSDDIATIEPDVSSAANEAAQHGHPLWVGEFGTMNMEWLAELYANLDRVQASSAQWVYEEWSQGSWGMWEPIDIDAEAEVFERGTLRTSYATTTARAYPQAIDGELLAFEFAPETRTLTVELANAGDGEHILAAPEMIYPDGVHVTCDGEEVEAASGPGRVTAVCAGAELALIPR